MNDRSATTIGTAPADVLGRHTADVRALPAVDPRVGTEALVQLVAADVDRHHPIGAPLEQHVGEAAGGRAGVDGPTAVDGDGEAIEGGVELLAAAPDEAGWRAADLDRLTGVDETSRLGRDGAGHEDPAAVDEDARLLSARRESAPDQLDVETSASSRVECSWRRRTDRRQLADFFAVDFFAVDVLFAGPSSPSTSSPWPSSPSAFFLAGAFLAAAFFLAGAFFAGDFFLAVAFFAADAFLADDFLAGATFRAAERTADRRDRRREVGDLLDGRGEVLLGDQAERLGPLLDRREDLLDQRLGVPAAALEELGDGGLHLLALHLARLHQVRDDRLGPGLGQLGEGQRRRRGTA